jgi:hypothetical protein
MKTRKAPKRLFRRQPAPSTDKAAPPEAAEPRVMPEPPGFTHPASPLADDFNLEAAEMLCDAVADIRTEFGPAILVEPLVGPDSGPDFDRELTGAGVVRFIRPVMAGDWDHIPPESELAPHTVGARHVLVAAISPRVRMRRPILVVMNHEMN